MKIFLRLTGYVFERMTQVASTGVADLETFAVGLQKELTAIKAALTLPYSSGPVEGQINRLKLIKRSMYNRGSFALLRRRVLYADSLHESCG
jgi:transposase